jgi:pimeloyl-ACP methyl ester carboxylesterase
MPTRVGRAAARCQIDPQAAERHRPADDAGAVRARRARFSYVELFGRHLEANVPNARLVVLPGVAHLVAVEAPEETARLVLDLIRPLGDFRQTA